MPPRPSLSRSGLPFHRLVVILCILLAGCASNPQQLSDPWLATDKALHFFAGVAVGVTGAGIAQSNGYSPCGATSGGVGLAFSVGLTKEWYDGKSSTGTRSGKDLLATVVGGIIGAQLVGECHR